MFISKLTRALESDGLVTRDRDPKDRRAVQLRLTAHGLDVVTTAIGIVQVLEERNLAPLGGRASQLSAELREMLGMLLADEAHHDDTPTDP